MASACEVLMRAARAWLGAGRAEDDCGPLVVRLERHDRVAVSLSCPPGAFEFRPIPLRRVGGQKGAIFDNERLDEIPCGGGKDWPPFGLVALKQCLIRPPLQNG